MIYSLRLKEVRENKNILQKDLAEVLKISRYTFSHYENEQDIMPLKHVNILCNYLNISIDYFFCLNTEKNYGATNVLIDKIKAGERLKEFRKENKLTQEKLATILKTHKTVICNCEKGRKTLATPFLYTICKKYNISADYLLGKVDEPKYLK